MGAYTKDAKTIDEQINILLSKGLVINDVHKAKEILFAVNYYSFSGYLFDYKDANGQFNGISFEEIYRIYKCDERLKSLLMYAIEIIEHNLKTKISYYVAHLDTPMGFNNVSNFIDANEHQVLMDKFNKCVKQNKRLPFVNHHITKYNNQFPAWVAVELFTFGMIKNCYSNLKSRLSKPIAKEFNTGAIQLSSWIDCVCYMRNLAAHYMRLYNFNIRKTPKFCNRNFNHFSYTNKIYDIVYVMRFLVPDKNEWNNYIIKTIDDIFTEYADAIDISAYGFPLDWNNILRIH